MKLLEKIKNFFFKKKQELHLSKEDLEIFAKTLNDPPNPNDKLKRAVKNYTLATKFNEDKVRLKSFIEPHIKELDHYFYKSLQLISKIQLDDLRCSLTQSNSISFRLFKDKFEVSFEVFYTKDSKYDNIEVVYTIYEPLLN